VSRRTTSIVLGLALGAAAAVPMPSGAQTPLGTQTPPGMQTPLDAPMLPDARMQETGSVARGGRSFAYQIRRLPVSSFPELPANMAAELERQDCMIPQTYSARRPENVVEASLESAGTKDWAVLCSARGTVRLLVFFASSPLGSSVLQSADEKARLQEHDGTGTLGFDWAIDRATPERVHQAQAGLERRPARLTHDAVADIRIDHETTYYFHAAKSWSRVETSE